MRTASEHSPGVIRRRESVVLRDLPRYYGSEPITWKDSRILVRASRSASLAICISTRIRKAFELSRGTAVNTTNTLPVFSQL